MTYIKSSDVSSMVTDTLQKNASQELETMGLDLRGIESTSSKEIKIKRIAAQFEEMLINTLLKTALKEDKEDKEGMALSFGPVNDLRNMLLSQHIANNGGLGYSKIIEEQIKNIYSQQESSGEVRTTDISSIPTVTSPVPTNQAHNQTKPINETGNTGRTNVTQHPTTTHSIGPTNQMESLDVVQPVESDISSDFGWRQDPIDGTKRFHSGIDYSVPTHTPVKSVMDGEVTYSGWKKGYGNLVEITHPDGYISRYGHNSRLSVKEGDQVKAGTMIARSGSTGRSTGPHLHFEIRKGDQALDPKSFLKQQKINVLAQKSDIDNVGP